MAAVTENSRCNATTTLKEKNDPVNNDNDP